MISVVIIGSGNVANHLIMACYNNPFIDLIQVFSRSKNQFPNLEPQVSIIHDWEQLKEADLYILAVSDNAIAEVSSKLPFANRLVVHTSGTMPMTLLDAKNRRGVLYPLQTFSKTKNIDFKKVPLCIEAENEVDLKLLQELAANWVNNSYIISSEQRKALHVAAVFVNNFVNHLYKIGNDICVDNNMSFEILKPLIMETADKINYLSPTNAQTGPAKREDTITINEHLKFISNDNQKEIYKLLTQSIINHG